ncbi:MAG: ArsA family ATPase [Bernardetiaceae bacterium]
MRIILFTGKGGVGKTTIAAATAHQLAKEGYKTLVISTDPAHSLSDSLDVPLSPEPTQVSQNLWAQELDVYYSMKKHWGSIRELLLTVYKWQGIDKIIAEELSALPGMEEGSAFLWMEQYYSEGFYDVIIIDSAPTGETLTFLTLPQVTQWWLQQSFPFQKTIIKSVGASVRTFTGVPLDKGYEELESLFDKLSRIQKIFNDPKITSIRLVMNPERMVIKEAQRAYAFLLMYGYAIDAVVVNRILPQTAESTFLDQYVQSQAKYLQMIEDDFAPLPILHVPHLGEEVFGQDRLQLLANQLYSDQRSPYEVLFDTKPYQVKEYKNGYLLQLALPFMETESVKIIHRQDQLTLQLLNRRRNLILPRFLAYYTIDKHEIKDKVLHIYFVPRAA